jgi:hypothetical protein
LNGKNLDLVILLNHESINIKDFEVPKSMKDVAGASNIKRKIIARVYRQLILKLDYKVYCIQKQSN